MEEEEREGEQWQQNETAKDVASVVMFKASGVALGRESAEELSADGGGGREKGRRERGGISGISV